MASHDGYDINHIPTIIYLTDHLSSPPRINAPSGAHWHTVDDEITNTPNSCEAKLLSFVHKAVSQFQTGASGMLTSPLAVVKVFHIVKMLGVMEELHACPLGSDQLQGSWMKAFMGMEDDDIIAFYFQMHNAAVIFRRLKTMVIFSSFEVSPNPTMDHHVGPMTSDNLRCSYPASSIAIPIKTFFHQSFLEQFTILLTSLSAGPESQLLVKDQAQLLDQDGCEHLHSARSQWKSGAVPIRKAEWDSTKWESVAPIYITEFLTGILRGIGESVSLDSHVGNLILKRAAGQVLRTGHDTRNSKIWFRSPTWLVIRVTMQIYLVQQATANTNISQRHWDYKLLILYIHAALLDQTLPDTHECLGEKLCHMSRKLTARAAKLEAAGLTIPTMLLQYVSTTVRSAVGVLGQRFEQARAATIRNLQWPPVRGLDLDRDATVQMLGGRSYIQAILERTFHGKTTQLEVPHSFLEAEPPTIFHEETAFQAILTSAKNLRKGVERSKYTKSRYRFALGTPGFILLRDVERWVETALEDYASANSKCEKACCDLYELLSSYSRAAKYAYESSPVDSSLKYLTEIELWKAIDTIATNIIPLLREYPCEVNPNLFDALLLPTRSQLKRLQSVRTYIRNRQAKATHPSILTGYLGTTREINDSIEIVTMAGHGSHTFSVRYFDQSPIHQALYDLVTRSGWEDVNAAWRVDRVRSKTATALTLDDIQYKAIIFELDPPIAFSVWRAATVAYYPETPAYFTAGSTLGNMADNIPYGPHSPEYTCYSISKHSSLDTHYLQLRGVLQKVPTDLQLADSFRFCMIRNRQYKDMNFHLYHFHNWNLGHTSDFNHGSVNLTAVEAENTRFTLQVNWVGVKRDFIQWAVHCKYRMLEYGSIPKREMHNSCRFKLRGFNRLQEFVDSTDHTSNYVICSQSLQPSDWLLHEYFAFAMLRAGFRLQWLNILREIQTGNLSLNRPEVVYLFLQASWQAGPQGATDIHVGETHEILLDSEFCNHLLDALERSCAGIKDDWRQQMTMYLIICLGTRVLSLAEDHQIRGRVFSLLRLCRVVCIDWLQDILRRVQLSSDDVSRKRWQAKGFAVAATCRQVFNVDPDAIFAVISNERDLGDFIECAVCITSITPGPTYEYVDQGHYFLHEEDRRLAHKIEHYLRELVLSNNDWFHHGISRVLPDYKPGADWVVLDAPNNRWITTISQGEVPMRVDYNLLKGTMLVNGKRLGYLPEQFTDHALYKKIFKKQNFFVVNTNMSAMQFLTVHSVSVAGSRVMLYFSMQEQDLIIRVKTDQTSYEIIPHTVLHKDFPQTMLGPYVHLLQLSEKEKPKLELRKLKNDSSLWESTSDWVITISTWGDSWSAHGRSTNGRNLRLIDYHSPTQDALAQLFAPIAEKSYLEVTFCPIYKKVHVKLTQYGLEFDLNSYGTQTGDTEITCSTFPGMVVDLRAEVGQDLQTLYGLKSYLALREAEFPPSEARRTVIIPYGQVSYVTEKHHTSVWIDTSSMPIVRYQLYSIDTLLRRLVSDSSVESLLYKAYLHALTSYCLPDPLTGLTGTQQALDDLRCAQIWSFGKSHDSGSLNESEELMTTEKKQPSESEILQLISSLTPPRKLRWEHEASDNPRCAAVQRIYWDPNLPFFCQHRHFALIAMSIKRNWNRYLEVQRLEFRDDAYPNDSFTYIPSMREVGYQANDDDVKLMIELLSGDARSPCPLPFSPDEIYEGRGLSDRNLGFLVARISALTNRWAGNLNPTAIFPKLMGEWTEVCASTDKILHYHHGLHRASLVEYWCSLYEFCRNCSQEKDRYKLLFFLSAFAYSAGNIATAPELLRPISIEKTARGLLKKVFDQKASEHGGPEEEQGLGLVARVQHQEQRVATIALLETLLTIATNPIFSDLPLPTDPMRLTGDHSENKAWINYAKAVQGKLDRIRYRNKLNILRHINKPDPPPLPLTKLDNVISAYQFPSNYYDVSKTYQHLVPVQLSTKCLLDFGLYATMATPPSTEYEQNTAPEPDGRTPNLDTLKMLLDRFALNATGFHQRYSGDLQKSYQALHVHELALLKKPAVTLPAIEFAESYLWQCKTQMKTILNLVFSMYTPDPGVLTIDELLYTVGLASRISVKDILTQLQGANMNALEKTPSWKKTLVSFGRSITQYQQATRMYRATRQADLLNFTQEWENKGHLGWDPLEFPEWLLFEIENNLLIRPGQAAIAKEMITPHTGSNTLMQLNMGEGKSSVIAPIVAVALANRKKLVRIVVLEPLLEQMFDLLTRKLGTLLTRRIYYIPFSRKLKSEPLLTGMGNPLGIQKILEECMNNGGILLAQPEHLLSFKLRAVELLINQTWEPRLVDRLLKTQQWLDRNTRDIFDESDELLHARYELVYPIGQRQPLELGMQRWVMIQEIFTLLGKHIRLLTDVYPSEIELIERQNAPGSFPFTRLLERNSGKILMGLVATDILETNLRDWVSEEHINDRLYEVVLRYVTDQDAKESEIVLDLKTIPPAITLLKGLIGHDIIAFVLREKRWRVDYGLHDCNLAVPYRAKDTPVPRAQFAHPDIKIALTCLCYYYQGLTESQLRDCFRHLRGFIDPGKEYHDWIRDCKRFLPPPLRDLNGINLDDTYQWSHSLYPIFRLLKTVIDFYLSRLVFPLECQEYPEKLSMSAWDLAENKSHPTTGFSGTNDTRYLLPTSIEQVETEAQLHTNAKVLNYLLRPENRYYECLQTTSGKPVSERELLVKMVDDDNQMGQIQVIVDVGAQVLNMDNGQVSWHWLKEAARRDSKWTAALFFNTNGELTVVGIDGRIQPYRTSPYVKNMMQCLVYLDEAHSRGTDIKLPQKSVGAVTLGTKLTKDKLAQACMRMRNLGYGQTVCFFAPPDVHQKIVHHRITPDTRPIETIDILSWVLHESVIQTQQNIPLWASQGIDHQTRSMIMKRRNVRYKQFDPTTLKQAGSKTLTEMYSTAYRDSNSVKDLIEHKLHDSQLKDRKKEFLAIKNRCEEHEITNLREVSLYELQEREVMREIIEEHNSTQTPAPEIKPCTHKLHPSLIKFIETGVLPPRYGTWRSPFCTLMDTLKGTSFNNQIELERWTSNILTTTDFALTVKELHHDRSYFSRETSFTTDLYLRPVTWILSTDKIQDGHLTLILLSPFEVNELLPRIRKSKFVNLHMYSAKIQKLTTDFYDLSALAIPPIPDRSQWQKKYPNIKDLMVQINLYAGGLFFGSYEMYCRTCEFLGIYLGAKETPMLHAGGCEQRPGKVTGQSNKHLELVRHLVQARTREGKIYHTHIEALLRSRVLDEKYWDTAA